jgi:hypothetical protein
MDIILNKIFLEKSYDGDGYQLRFGDMYNTITDYFDEMNVNYMKYHSLTDSICSTISTLSVGIFAMLKTYKGSECQRDKVDIYISKLISLINTTNYKKDYEFSFIDSIKSYFNESEDKKESESENKEDKEFENINKLIISSFSDKSYHEDYLIQLSLVSFAFIKMVEDQNDQSELFSKFLIKLKEMDNVSYIYNFYDNPNYRGYIKF